MERGREIRQRIKLNQVPNFCPPLGGGGGGGDLEKPVILTKMQLIVLPDTGPKNGKLPPHTMFNSNYNVSRYTNNHPIQY